MSKKMKLTFELINYLLHPKEVLKTCRENGIQTKKENDLLEIFNKDFESYNALAKPDKKAYKQDLFPCLFDKTTETQIEPIYFYQDSWAFERIYAYKPKKHIDIGSHHKFCAFLSKITDLTMIDIRPLSLPLDSIKFLHGNLLNLPFNNKSIDSLSSLCVIEHIGLGRYGDTLDPNGSEKAIIEINRVLKPGAHFYFSVPVETDSKTYFNAHRTFNENYLLNTLLNNYNVLDVRYIEGNTFTDVLPVNFSIGCYHLQKK